MIPVCFDGLSATLHQAPGQRGVILVSSPGFEDLCAHRAFIGLARDIAGRGAPVLRLDLFGTGDSLGAESEPDLVARWKSDIAAAIRFMRQDLDCTQICLVGLRLGALLAAQELDLLTASDRLALLAPPPSGKSYLREARVLSRVIDSGAAADASGLSLAGFRTGEASQREIQALEWPTRTAPACGSVLVCAAPLEPIASKLANLIGLQVDRLEFSGYDRMMCDPTASVVPGAVMRGIADWLTGNMPEGTRQQRRLPAARLESGHWREEGLRFGEQGRLSGILCTPRDGTDAPLVVFAHPGGIRRIGWGRMWVEIARNLAKEGIASLRFDFSYVAPDFATDEPVSAYGEAVWMELVKAIDCAKAHDVSGPVIVIGPCSGAYHALRAASADPRIAGVVLVNQLCFRWGPEYSVPYSAWVAQKASDLQRKRQGEDEALSDITRMKARAMTKVVKIAKTSAKSALRVLKQAADLLPSSGESRSEPEQTFDSLSRRGCLIRLVHSAGDGSLHELARYFGPGGERALSLPGVTQTIIPDCDHVMTPRHARTALLDLLRETAKTCRRPRPSMIERLSA